MPEASLRASGGISTLGARGTSIGRVYRPLRLHWICMMRQLERLLRYISVDELSYGHGQNRHRAGAEHRKR